MNVTRNKEERIKLCKYCKKVITRRNNVRRYQKRMYCNEECKRRYRKELGDNMARKIRVFDGEKVKEYSDINNLKKDTTFSKFKKKPIIIEAVRMNNDFEVETLEGTMKGKIDDYLIIGIKGEIYPCDCDIFNETYEYVENSATKNNKIQVEKQW